MCMNISFATARGRSEATWRVHTLVNIEGFPRHSSVRTRTRTWSRNSARMAADSLAMRARSSAAVLHFRTALMRSLHPPRLSAESVTVAD